ncbi:hypothetical protein PILCRDRAFT_811167 [Piloderma croceum F 1598]|uniref:Sjogrens syndrome scleroderma autoantigen 1 family protein n=1 Tax=Piloderma croceum (strain F 1598) TaxID=765440 RepID=A0A0C3BVZ6_PILCF|nr:hypothetical protein PILCRDRAFT_811167 [Piloderma croceum F 1598]
MTTITDVPAKLGEYMLKGWVLTDNSCPNTGCIIPLMRSPDGRSPVTYYCANCDENSTSWQCATSAISQPQPVQAQPSPSVSSSSHHSRTSTPPTELSSDLSSPTFAPPVDTAESLWRRQQSDTASSEIGRRLLKGWAMLAEECPNIRCFGVPLVRPPKVGGGKDPRKECVICDTVYVSEKDSNGWEQLVPFNTTVPEQLPNDPILAPPSVVEVASFRSSNQGNTSACDELPRVGKILTDALEPSGLDITPVRSAQSTKPITQTAQTNTSIFPLEVAAKSLELTLVTLSERLTFLSSGRSPVDPSSIALTAEAIGKVVAALAQAKQLHWSESRVGP